MSRILAVVDGPNPSFDYYLAPRLRSVPTRIANLADPPPADHDWSQTFVLFCRYLSRPWLDAIDRHRASLAGVGLFLDDDIDALAADATIPAWYRLRLFRRHLRFRGRLRGGLDRLWVSNPRIAERHHGPSGLLTPVAGVEDHGAPRPHQGGLRVAFHSTSVHRQEHRWLRPIVENALAAVPDLRVEVAAGWRLARLWRGLPRTKVVPSTPWPEFRATTARTGADLLLAPLLPSQANRARAWTKRIDAMRLDAALLTSEPSVYFPGDEERRAGMCLPCDPAAWTAAIVALAADRARLDRLRSLNRAFVMRSAQEALPADLWQDPA